MILEPPLSTDASPCALSLDRFTSYRDPPEAVDDPPAEKEEEEELLEPLDPLEKELEDLETSADESDCPLDTSAT